MKRTILGIAVLALAFSAPIGVAAGRGESVHTFAGAAAGAGDIEFGPFVLQDDGRMYLTDISGTTDARLIIGQLGAPMWPPPSS